MSLSTAGMCLKSSFTPPNPGFIESLQPTWVNISNKLSAMSQTSFWEKTGCCYAKNMESGKKTDWPSLDYLAHKQNNEENKSKTWLYAYMNYSFILPPCQCLEITYSSSLNSVPSSLHCNVNIAWSQKAPTAAVFDDGLQLEAAHWFVYRFLWTTLCLPLSCVSLSPFPLWEHSWY